MKYRIIVFGIKVVDIEDKKKAERYAQAIREGFWQCGMTLEPWKKNKKTGTHKCCDQCLDSRTDEEVKIKPVNDTEFI